MSFDIFLVASDQSPPAVEFGARVQAATQAAGFRPTFDGVPQVADDGEEFELYAGGKEQSAMFSLRNLSGRLCNAICHAAELTRSFVVPSSSEGIAFRIKEHSGIPPEDFLPIREIADGAALYAALQNDFSDWRDYVMSVA